MVKSVSWRAHYGVVGLLVSVTLAGCALPESEPYVRRPMDLGGRSLARPPEPTRDIPALPESPTLDDLRLYAAYQNAGLRARFHELQAQAQRSTQVRALPEPRFTYSEYLEEIETRTGPQERSYSVAQSFPWFGKLRLRGEIEEQGTGIAWQRFLAAQLSLDRSVRTTYADYYYLGRSLSITRENLELLGRLESVARQKLAAGANNHPDIIRLQVEIGRLEDQLKTLTDLQAPLRAKLNALLNRPKDSPLGLPSELTVRDSTIEPDAIRDHLEKNNPDLVAIYYEIEQAELGRQLARKEYFPDFSLGVKTIETGTAAFPGTSGSGDDPWLLTFSVELPLWHSKYRAAEIEAREKSYAAARKREDVTNQLEADVERALYEQRDAERRLRLYNDTLIPKAQESLRATEAAFEAGRSDFLDLIDAERALLEFQLSGERGRSDLLRATAELDRLLGRYVIGPTQLERGDQR